ncbi:hypothetical protein [Streptomyces sindenensis]|nr:hypothetical protein [Streptomyces sindenensis]
MQEPEDPQEDLAALLDALSDVGRDVTALKERQEQDRSGLARELSSVRTDVSGIDDRLRSVADDVSRTETSSRAVRETTEAYMERIRELESTIDRLRATHRATDPVVLDARMQLARITGESGDRRGAITLYRTLAGECRADLGPYDPRTLDAFEEMAWWISGSGR